MAIEYKYLQNLASDECHRLLVDEAGRPRPTETCNTDQIDHKAWLSQEEAEALPVEHRCGHCWPKVAASA